jgi:Rps23 Pro-64 3,4-dihydroxylase Tpa1-like proline 4-hydroxylase
LFPSSSSPIWHPYNNPLEIKLACNNMDKLSPELHEVFYALNSPDFIKLISQISGELLCLFFTVDIPELEADPFMHGGGLHCHPPGGKLDVHLDYMVHPLLPQKERRLNLIVYLNSGWQPEFKGELELWDKDLSQCVTRCFALTLLSNKQSAPPFESGSHFSDK